jgi:hypothetical protein
MMDEEDYYSPWEWQPLENMPNGCNDITVEFVDGSRSIMCSCDYWWNVSNMRYETSESQPLKFRYIYN